MRIIITEFVSICSAIGDAMFAPLAANLRAGIKESELYGIPPNVAHRVGARVYSGVLVSSGSFA